MTTRTEPSVVCPELEELAAFIDGKLSGAARDAVVEHLASCKACYEVYAETLRIQEDVRQDAIQEDDGPQSVPAAGDDEDPVSLAPVVRHPRSFGWAWRSAAAIAAAVVLAAGLLYFLRPPAGPIGNLGIVVAGLDQGGRSALESESFEHGWPVTRGGAPDLSQTDRDSARRAFRLGVHAVDLEARIALDDRYGAEAQTHQIEILLSQLVLSQPFVVVCRQVRDDIHGGNPWDEIRKSSSELMESLVEGEYPPVDPFYYSFGVWAEKSRLLALAGEEPYFGKREFTRFLGRLEDRELGESISRRVEEVRRLVDSKPIPRDELIRVLEEIIKLEGIR